MLSTSALEVLLAKMNKYGSDQPYMGHACITKQCNHFENKENGIVAKQRLHIRSVFARRRADTWDFEGKEVGGGGRKAQFVVRHFFNTRRTHSTSQGFSLTDPTALRSTPLGQSKLWYKEKEGDRHISQKHTIHRFKLAQGGEKTSNRHGGRTRHFHRTTVHFRGTETLVHDCTHPTEMSTLRSPLTRRRGGN